LPFGERVPNSWPAQAALPVSDLRN